MKNNKNNENNENNNKLTTPQTENNGVVDSKIDKQLNYNAGNEVTKRDKKATSAQKAVPALIIVSVSLGIILLALLIAFYQVLDSKKQSETTLESIYASSYYSMVDNINNLQIDSAKFETLSNANSQRMSLSSMSEDCSYILGGLNVLPISHENSISATKFFNQIQGMCEAFINKLNKGESLSSDDINTVGQASLVLGVLKDSFNKQNASIAKEGFKFIDAAVFNKAGMNEFSTSMGDISSSNIDYPAMIFDGPFSSALETREIKGLSDNEISKEDALKYVKEVFGNIENISVDFEKETKGEFETFDFNIKFDGRTLMAQITKKGGFLLNVNGGSEEAQPIINSEKAIELAESFAKKVGVENAKAVWEEIHENIAYINLVPMQDDVILYPDLIKAKIDLTAGIIIGWESRNYAFNHTDRNLDFKISETNAKSILTGDYNLESVKKAVIPMEDRSELSTYELKCEKMDGIYYIYVNSQTGNVEKIMKVVDSNGVKKLI